MWQTLVGCAFCDAPSGTETSSGRYSIGGGLLCEMGPKTLSTGERGFERSIATWYVTENGQTAHQNCDCSALDHATVVETLTTAAMMNTASTSGNSISTPAAIFEKSDGS